MNTGNSRKKLPVLVLFQNIHELPLSRFIDCVVDGNLYALVKSGIVVNPIILYNTWTDILEQYSQAVGTQEYKTYIALKDEIHAIELRYKRITDILSMLQPGIYSRKLCDALNKEVGCKLAFDYTNEKAYAKDLKSCKSKSSSLKILLDMKRLQFNGIKNKQEKNIAPDRMYYDSLLISLQDDTPQPLTCETMTVSQFIERLKRHNQKVKDLEALQKRK